MKIIGVIWIILGSTGMGVWFRSAYLQKLSILENCEKALLVLRGEIEYGRTMLPEAFLQASKSCSGKISLFFERMSCYTREGKMSLTKVWQKACDETFAPDELGRTTEQEWRAIGDVLSMPEWKQQIQMLTLCQKRLAYAREQWQKKKDQKTRLYPGFGAITGCMLCIFLF